jgi:hypothetical protein
VSADHSLRRQRTQTISEHTHRAFEKTFVTNLDCMAVSASYSQPGFVDPPAAGCTLFSAVAVRMSTLTLAFGSAYRSSSLCQSRPTNTEKTKSTPDRVGILQSSSETHHPGC